MNYYSLQYNLLRCLTAGLVSIFLGVTATASPATLVAPEFITVSGGIYKMGSLPTEPNRMPDERLHEIELSAYDISETAVTQEQYASIMGINPSKFKDPNDCPSSFKYISLKQKQIPVCADYPVENVNWYDATEYARLLSEKSSKYIYRLPSEAQLEIAFRAGTNTAFISGNDQAMIGDYVWYKGNSNGQTHPVKSTKPNGFGFYRSSVWEWSEDWSDRNYQWSQGLDPKGPPSGTRHVLRGGSWNRDASRTRSAFRAYDVPELRNEQGTLGFRLIRLDRSSASETNQSVLKEGSENLNFRSIPEGIYQIGSPDKEPDHLPDEKLHSVKLDAYEISDAAVTQEQYAIMMGVNPSQFQTAHFCPHSFKNIETKGKKIPVCADYPVENVTWNDAKKYANLESEKDSKFVYDLPTEAQQEVAFRGGTSTSYVSGDDSSDLANFVWYSDDYLDEQTHSVKSKHPNQLGIYRSSVWEWSNDWYDKNYNGADGWRRVTRGCSHINIAKECRSAARHALSPNEQQNYGLVGFRLVRKPINPS